MNVSLRQIEVFLAVAQTMSFSQAAKACHLSQPALSANIKRLEDALGARLFDRHTRKVALTPVGRELMVVAEGMTQSMTLAMGRMQDFVAGKRGRLVVAAAPSMAAGFVPGVISRFSRLHPGLDIELCDALSQVCEQMVQNGTADVAIAPIGDMGKKADDIVLLELFRDPLVVVCPVGHPLAKRATVGWRDLQEYPHIVLNGGSGARQLIDSEFVRHQMRLRPAFEVAHIGTLLGLVAADLGIAAAPQSLVEGIALPGLTSVRINSAAAYRAICALTPRNRTLSPPVPQFVELCKQAAQEKKAGTDDGARRRSSTSKRRR